jgi:formate hydrogenlyase subunit 3/multisubunit Na+/H+ antiporter MnhD subunit
VPSRSGKMSSSEKRMAEAKATKAEPANTMRDVFGRVLLGVLVVQILGADAVFVLYAWKGVDRNVPTATVSVWLSAVVVQVIGVVLVVVKYLFPEGGETT